MTIVHLHLIRRSWRCHFIYFLFRCHFSCSLNTRPPCTYIKKWRAQNLQTISQGYLWCHLALAVCHSISIWCWFRFCCHFLILFGSTLTSFFPSLLTFNHVKLQSIAFISKRLRCQQNHEESNRILSVLQYSIWEMNRFIVDWTQKAHRIKTKSPKSIRNVIIYEFTHRNKI